MSEISFQNSRPRTFINPFIIFRTVYQENFETLELLLQFKNFFILMIVSAKK